MTIEVRRNWGRKNLRSRGSTFSSAFSPYEVDGLVEWKRADLGITMVSGTLVATASCQIGGPAWTQASSAAMPNRVGDARLGNRETFKFNGTSQYLTFTGTPFGSAGSVMIVGYPAAAGSAPVGGTGHTFGFLSQIVGRWAWNNDTDIKQMSPAFGVGFVGVVQQTDGVALVGRANGVQQFAQVPTKNLATRQFRSVGAHFNATSFSDAAIAEMAIYSVQISPTDARRLENYAALRYALPVS